MEKSEFKTSLRQTIFVQDTQVTGKLTNNYIY